MSSDAGAQTVAELARALREAVGCGPGFRGSIMLHFDDGEATRYECKTFGRVGEGVDHREAGSVALQ